MIEGLRAREERLVALAHSVFCVECLLPAVARGLVMYTASFSFDRLESSVPALARACSLSERTTRKYLRILEERCGEDPVPFLRDVINGERTLAEWREALEAHGGRRRA